MSLNYFVHIEDTVHVSVVEKGTNALTDEALEIYSNDHENFGVVCGDNFISSYKEGALYMFSIVTEFASPYDKKVFGENEPPFDLAPQIFGDIVHATH